MDAAVGTSQVDEAVSTHDTSPTQQNSSSAVFSAASCSRDQEAQPQKQLQETGATPSEQQLLLQQKAMEAQLSQFIDRQAEHLNRQVQLEQQQQEQQQQQQKLIQHLQVQQDELARGQVEIRGHQQQLEKQHAEQQQFIQQSEEMQLLLAWAKRTVNEKVPECEKQQVLPNAEESGTGSNQQEVLLTGVEPPTKRNSVERGGTTDATPCFLSPVNEEHADDDEYTCI